MPGPAIASRFLILTLLLAGAWLGPRPACAVTLVVLEARGVALSPGQAIDGGKPLALTDGQQVSLISPDGKMVKLRGPSNAAPLPEKEAATADLAAAMRALITQETGREKAGVIRGGGKLVVPPDPWLVDIGSPGMRCLPADKPITFWRADSSATVPLVVSPADRSWKARADWPAGEDRLTLPRTIPLRLRSTFVVRTNDGDVTLTLVAMPLSLDNDAMRAAFMIEEGCDAQVKALFAQVDKARK